MKDAIMSRMKEQYENRTKFLLPRRSYVILRFDGVAFHTFCKGLKKPFDEELIYDMNETAKFLCEKIQGAKFGFVQSDEISILVTDFDRIETSAWFNNEVQKIVSVGAAMATAKFNELRTKRNLKIMEDLRQPDEIYIDYSKNKIAFFDNRAFTIPDREEVMNYFIARQKDCTKNSVSMVAQSLYSHKQLNGISTNDMQELIFKKGINWNDYPVRQKRGGFIEKVSFMKDNAKRSRWEVVEPPIFTQERKFLNRRVPKYQPILEEFA